MRKIIDFHTHILPAMDDGSRSVEESLAILQEEARQGVVAAILTPHFYAQQNSPEEFLARRAQAWQALLPHTGGLPTLFLGAEVHYFEGIAAVQGLERLCIEKTDLLLVEMPMCRWSSRMVDELVALNSRKDICVVLAHIERYLSMQSPQTIQRLLSIGILFQANVSFFGDWQTRRKAIAMAQRGQIHLLGSDCHSMGTRRPNWNKLPEQADPLHEQGYRLLMRHRTQG